MPKYTWKERPEYGDAEISLTAQNDDEALRKIYYLIRDGSMGRWQKAEKVK